MPMRKFTASAPGKAMLFGEHAVEYGRPAIALPIASVEAVAEASERESGVHLKAVDFAEEYTITKRELVEGDKGYALQEAVYNTCDYLQRKPEGMEIRVTSSVPIGAGMGSGAAVSVAVVRAVAGFIRKELLPEEVNYLAYKSEIIHHGTPSGIDNTTIAYGRPVYFKSEPRVMERLEVAKPFGIVLGDTGVRSSAKEVADMVREDRRKDYSAYKSVWDEIGALSESAKAMIASGNPEDMGPLMDRNHELLRGIGVSCEELDSLVEAAKSAGALGAKMSGAGKGGIIIALCAPGGASGIADVIRSAGAGAIEAEIGGKAEKIAN